MRAWWSVLLLPQRRAHLHRSCDCSLLCLEEPIRKSASGPLALRISRSFFEISSLAWSQLPFGHLPPSSFIGDFRRYESCVMPCSRTDAPLAQCPPRLRGESNTGSWRIQTPFCTTASIAQPTEQCVQTVRFTSTLAPASSFAWASCIIENGSCDATAPAPTVTPERLRKARRSMVFTAIDERPRDRRGWATAWLVALRVRSMGYSSNLGGTVVVVDVLAGLIALRCTLVVRRRSRLLGG